MAFSKGLEEHVPKMDGRQRRWHSHFLHVSTGASSRAVPTSERGDVEREI